MTDAAYINAELAMNVLQLFVVAVAWNDYFLENKIFQRTRKNCEQAKQNRTLLINELYLLSKTEVTSSIYETQVCLTLMIIQFRFSFLI